MNRTERITEFLLYAYPATWRREYGDELALLLASRPLSLAVISDVVVNGIHQRLKQEDPWKPAAVVLVFWTVLCTIWNTIKPLSPATYSYIFWPLDIVSFAVGGWTILRDQTRLGHACVASLKSALVGVSPDLLIGLFWAIHVFHPTLLDMHGSPRMHGGGITILCARTDVTISALEFLLDLLLVTTAKSLLFGFLGAVLARLVVAVKSGYREA